MMASGDELNDDDAENLAGSADASKNLLGRGSMLQFVVAACSRGKPQGRIYFCSGARFIGTYGQRSYSENKSPFLGSGTVP
jgi:hypothetical protein